MTHPAPGNTSPAAPRKPTVTAATIATANPTARPLEQQEALVVVDPVHVPQDRAHDPQRGDHGQEGPYEAQGARAVEVSPCDHGGTARPRTPEGRAGSRAGTRGRGRGRRCCGRELSRLLVMSPMLGHRRATVKGPCHLRRSAPRADPGRVRRRHGRLPPTSHQESSSLRATYGVLTAHRRRCAPSVRVRRVEVRLPG